MPLTRSKKEQLVEKLKGIVDNSESIVFVNFKGLSVEKANQVRKQLKDEDVGYFVAKKTLIKRALNEGGISGDMPSLEGEIAVAYSNSDFIAPAREIYKFQKKEKDALSIAGGVFDGRYMNASEMTEVASIPSREVLLGQFVNLINSPLQGLAVVLDGIAEKKESASA
ncbi:MAG: 50S ribosomal protein L10 [Patescibacteria group bacterium]